jgi:hypothetical protein
LAIAGNSRSEAIYFAGNHVYLIYAKLADVKNIQAGAEN